ncbi:MAG TPA: methyltransferase [Ktedonobacterales bacterium]|nr:methyltransferase [Ktedonobacterales bacterium]
MAQRLRQFLLGVADRLLPAHIALVEHAHHAALMHLLAAFAELGIADHLAEGPKTAKELAGLVGGDADALHRALRAAAVVGIVRLDAAGTFHATRLTMPLRAHDPSAAADWCRYVGSPSIQAAWLNLTQTLRTGESAFRRVNGMDTFSWFDTHPEEGRRFTAGLGGLTRSDAPMIVTAYPFPNKGVLCDFAGGAGVLLGEVLRAHPGLRGILVEAPLVLAEAGTYLASIGLADRVQLVEGDLFRPMHASADLYLLKWILHDWDDPTCTVILKHVAAAMPRGARLVVIEGDQKRNRADARFSMLDAQMLTATDGGRERSGNEIAHLLAEAGLRPRRVRHTATDLVLVEATAHS